MAKETCDCLLHFAGRKSGFRNAGNLCWDPQVTQFIWSGSPHSPPQEPLHYEAIVPIWCTFSFFFLIFWKQNTSFASENNYNEVSSAVPHSILLTTCKQLVSVFLIKKGWLTPSITILTKTVNTHTYKEVQMVCRETFRRNLENGYGVNKKSFSRYWS